MPAEPRRDADLNAAAYSIKVACPCGNTVTIRADHADETVQCAACRRDVAIDVFGTFQPSQIDSRLTEETTPPSGERRSRHSDYEFLAPAQSAGELGRLGPYRVLEVLGAGGMGVVFKAEDPALARIVALKVMLPSATDSAAAKERFLREARMAAALDHDHVVRIFQVGEDRGVPFLAMEFLKGESLEDRLKRDGRIPIGEAVRIGREVADGLAVAHQHGLIHRDIKPANVWMEKRLVRRKDGSTDAPDRAPARVKILDFGLARGSGDATLTQVGAILGTPSYMPLEQARGDRVDIRCDLYSLGVVLYRMVTGELPFKGNNTLSVLAALVTKTATEPRKINPNVPVRLNDLLMRLLSKNAEDRPARAEEVYGALSEIEETLGEPLSAVEPARNTSIAPPVPNPLPRRERSRRWPLVALCLGFAAAAIVCGIVVFWPTPHGTVRIESDDPNVEITFDEAGPTIKGTSKSPISLTPGPHGLFVKRGDFEFVADRFEIKNGDTVTLKVERVNDKVRLVRDGRVLGEKDLPSPKIDPPHLKVEPAKTPTTPIAKVEPPPTRSNPAPEAKTVSAALKAGEEWTNELGMKFVWIPPGKFLMGSPKSEQDWVRKTFGDLGGALAAQETQHEVEITKGFYLGKYAVTQAEYEKVMGKNPSWFSSTGGGKDRVGALDTGRFPVEHLSWDDAREFCRKLSQREGKECRLPSEAEWEYACRAGTKTAFNVGDQLTERDANFDMKKGRPVAVGSYAANAWGLHDMHGNVWQWCEDRYAADYYTKSPAQDPPGPSVGTNRVYRGGSWLTSARVCRSADRSKNLPTDLGFYLGFRVVLRPAGIHQISSAPAATPTANPALRPAPIPPALKAGAEITNSIGTKLVYIPPGKFVMGSPKSEQDWLRKTYGEGIGRSAAQETQHEVEFTKGFCLGIHELTIGEFRKFVASTGYRTEPETDGKGGSGYDETADKFSQDVKYTWRNLGFAVTDAHPAANVTWNDAKAFCSWLSLKEGKTYRLPTEAEWEYACRGGTKTAYQGGDDPESLALIGNVTDGTFKAKFPKTIASAAIAAQDGYVFSAPVGQYRKNGFGIYDMHGNVAEWCEDWHDKDYYSRSPAQDPPGASTGTNRVFRGGSWHSNPRLCRSAQRTSFPPTFRKEYLGFRLVLEIRQGR
jgi:formylglycine-generating enzyme required for sulfatase activity/serine/threonine protein kinase